MARTLSEAASRALVAAAGVAVSPYVTAVDATTVVAAAAGLDRPLVVKLCGAAIAHKTERGLVRLNVRHDDDLTAAAEALLDATGPDDGPVELLVSTMVAGRRELIAGLVTDPQFGPTVMLGLGGIFAEAIADVVFRLAPITAVDAHEMIDELRAQAIFGEFRGEPSVDRTHLAATLVALSLLPTSHPEVVSVDLNPLIVVDGQPIAVDALVEVSA